MVLRYVGPNYTFEQQRVEINNLANDVAGLGTPTYSITAGYATTAGIATVAQGLTGTPNVTIGVVTATSVVIGSAVTITSGGIRASGIVTASSFRPSSGYYQSSNGTNAFYVFDTSGDVSFQGKIVTNYIRSNTNLNPTITVSDLDLQFARNVTISGITTITGNLNAPGNYYVKLARTTDQTALNGTDTLIGFSVVSDPNNWYSGITTRTTPTVAGTYHVDLMVNWLEGTITNNQTNIQIRKNGNTFALSMVGIHTFSYTQNACGIVTMNGTTDYIDATVYTSNPTSQVIRGPSDGAWTKMEVFKIN